MTVISVENRLTQASRRDSVEKGKEEGKARKTRIYLWTREIITMRLTADRAAVYLRINYLLALRRLVVVINT